MGFEGDAYTLLAAALGGFLAQASLGAIFARRVEEAIHLHVSPLVTRLTRIEAVCHRLETLTPPHGTPCPVRR